MKPYLVEFFKTCNKSVKTGKVCEAIVCLLLAVRDWVQDVIPKYGISKSWAFLLPQAFASDHALAGRRTVMSI